MFFGTSAIFIGQVHFAQNQQVDYLFNVWRNSKKFTGAFF